MSGHHLEVVPISRQHWVVRYEGDTSPIAEHVDPDLRAPTPGDVEGPHVEP